MIVDNFQLISSFLNFSDDNNFYKIVILSRNKDKAKNKTYEEIYIHSVSDLLENKDRIIKLCNLYNARAYIYFEKRNKEKVALKTMCLISEYIYCGDYKSVKNAYSRAFGRIRDEKLFLIDYDNNINYSSDIVLAYLREKNCVIECIVPTLNGIHYITQPFDKRLISNHPLFSDISCGVNDFTLLYYQKIE